MKLIIEGETLTDIYTQIVNMSYQLRPSYEEIESAGSSPVTTGIVEQDLTIVEPECVQPTGTPSREDLAPKRKRRTKAEMTATSMVDLADGPANSRPVTARPIGFLEPTSNPPFVKQGQPVPQQAVAPTVQSQEVDPKLDQFIKNFSTTIFIMLQENKIDQAYITEKVKYYGLKNFLEIKDDSAKLTHLYNTFVSEGRI